MSATFSPTNNPNDTTQPVSGDADVQMNGSGTSTTSSTSATAQSSDRHVLVMSGRSKFSLYKVSEIFGLT
jgi:hypothetical protein